MKHFVLLQALGDNLVTLSLLEQLNEKIQIIGTNNTKVIIKLMGIEDKFNIKVVFKDIPAFYDIKKQGVIKAIKDLYRFIIYINKNNIKTLVLEKKDLRSSLISFLTKSTIYYPNNLNSKVYKNRQSMIEKIYNQKITLITYSLSINNPKRIVINPLTRVELKNITKHHLAYIIKLLNSNGYKIYLIDIEKKYQELSNNVYKYLTNTTLEDVKQLIIKCDLYIGADSFLIHLAYYLKRNYFIIFYRDNDNFMPQNITNNFYIKANKIDNFNGEINKKFYNIGLLKNGE